MRAGSPVRNTQLVTLPPSSATRVPVGNTVSATPDPPTIVAIPSRSYLATSAPPRRSTRRTSSATTAKDAPGGGVVRHQRRYTPQRRLLLGEDPARTLGCQRAQGGPLRHRADEHGHGQA